MYVCLNVCVCVCEICGSINHIQYQHFPPSCEFRKILLLYGLTNVEHTEKYTCMYAQGFVIKYI